MIYNELINISCSRPRHESPLFETKYQDLDIKVHDSNPYEFAVVYWEKYLWSCRCLIRLLKKLGYQEKLVFYRWNAGDKELSNNKFCMVDAVNSVKTTTEI